MTKVVRAFLFWRYDSHVRRVMQIARNSLMVFSLLAFLAADVMWVRSYWVYEWWGRSFAKTDAVEQIIADGRKYRKEKRSVRLHQGVESIRGSIGIGMEGWDLVNSVPAIWKSVPDEDSLRHIRIYGGARPTKQPFLNKPKYFRGWLGFGLVEQPGVPAAKGVVIPYWFLVVCAGVWPGIFAMRRGRRWRWRRMGKCVSCGYDLRGGGERCPECGKEVAAKVE